MIVGKVELTKNKSEAVTVWQIAGLSILPDFRGLGIGERIMRESMFVLSQSNATMIISVNKENLRARKLYRKLGFGMVGNRDILKMCDIHYPPGEIVMTLDKSAARGV